MKLQTELLKASTGLADGRSYKALTRYDVGMLQAFYRSLDQEQRRIRFGAAVSDESIARYCEQIDWRSTLVIAFGTARELLAVATNVRIDIFRVENATVAAKEGEAAVSTLLRLSAVASRDLFAADRMLVNLDGANWLLRYVREIGAATLCEEYAEFDVRSITGEATRVDRARQSRIEVAAAPSF